MSIGIGVQPCMHVRSKSVVGLSYCGSSLYHRQTVGACKENPLAGVLGSRHGSLLRDLTCRAK